MESNARMITPEVLLRFMLYTSPTRTNAIPVTSDMWVDRQMAFGNAYDPGTNHQFKVINQSGETKNYVVAMLPLIRRVTDPRRPGKQTVHVTICFAKASDYPRFRPVDQLTPNEIRRSMMYLTQCIS